MRQAVEAMKKAVASMTLALAACGGSVSEPPVQEYPATPIVEPPPVEGPVLAAPRDSGRCCPWVQPSPGCWLNTCDGNIVCNDASAPDGGPVCGQ